MALKGDRFELYDNISMFANSVMERGGVVTYTGVGSGAAMDQAAAYVGYSAGSSGQTPAGLLLNDMVSIDLTRQHPNYYQDEVLVGGKVTLGKKGYWVTDMVVAGPVAAAKGDLAVLTSSGNIMNLPAAYEYNGSWNRAVNPKVGRFASTKDEDGYAKVEIDIL